MGKTWKETLQDYDAYMADYGGCEVKIPEGMRDVAGDWDLLTEEEAQAICEYNDVDIDFSYGDDEYEEDEED